MQFRTLSRVHAADLRDRASIRIPGDLFLGALKLKWRPRAFPKPYTAAFVDDDWYYEMCAVRAFEKYGIEMTVDDLGKQWLENSCGTWGSSAVALRNLRNGIPGCESGHPRYNRLWWTIGPVFTADLYGALAPGMPIEAARLARRFCSINGHGEALDGGAIFVGAISLGFVEKDVRTILRKAVTLVHPSSPYRQCVEEVIRMADGGRTFEEIVTAVEDRWRIECPASNNAVPNGGITAACLWFGEGDFWKAINLASRAADFTDTDNSAATAVSIIAAMKGTKALPRELVAQLGDRITAAKMGDVELTPPVDESIRALAKRTAAIGEKIIAAQGASIGDREITLTPQEPKEQPAQRFELGDLMQYWNPDWTLERAGFGGDDLGAMAGIRGQTALDGDVLITYPRDEARGLVLRRTTTLGAAPVLEFQVAADPDKAWELNVYAGNRRLLGRIIDGGEAKRTWQSIRLDLAEFSGKETTIRLYHRVLMPRANKVPGKAYWRGLTLK